MTELEKQIKNIIDAHTIYIDADKLKSPAKETQNKIENMENTIIILCKHVLNLTNAVKILSEKNNLDLKNFNLN